MVRKGFRERLTPPLEAHLGVASETAARGLGYSTSSESDVGGHGSGRS